MKILIVSFSVNGAMGDFMKQIISSLLNTADNIKIGVLTNVGVGLSASENLDVCTIKFDRKHPLDFIAIGSYFKIFKYLKSFKYEKVLFLSFHPVNLFMFRIVKKENVFVYVHDHEPHSGVRGMDLLILKKQLRDIYSYPFHLIVSSEYMKMDIMKKYPYLNMERLSVVFLGLLENFCFPCQDFAPTESIDILFFGRIEYYKGLDTLFEALNFIRRDNLKVVIIGKGDMLSIFGLKSLPHYVTHINTYMADEELVKHILDSKLIVMPYRDATGTQVIQTAFYYEKPIVATNVGCFPEYISDGEDGIIVSKEKPLELYNAIERLLSDDDLRHKMGAKGKEKVETIFSNRVIGNKLLEIMKN